jgi:predicted metalloprotease with PDZ domain
MILDIELIAATNGRKSMDDVMHNMYHAFAKNKIGYSVDDYWKTLEATGLSNANEFRTNIAEKAVDYSEYLQKAFQKIGVELVWLPSAIPTERLFGFSVDIMNDKSIVNSVCPNSAADLAGLWYGDELIDIDGIGVAKNVQFLLENTTEANIRFIRNKIEFETTLNSSIEQSTIQKVEIIFPTQPNQLFLQWIGQRFK